MEYSQVLRFCDGESSFIWREGGRGPPLDGRLETSLIRIQEARGVWRTVRQFLYVMLSQCNGFHLDDSLFVVLLASDLLCLAAD